jgi:hypothetical protein
MIDCVIRFLVWCDGPTDPTAARLRERARIVPETRYASQTLAPLSPRIW